MATKPFHMKITDDREAEYQKLRKKYPALPESFSTKSIDTMITLLMTLENKS